MEILHLIYYLLYLIVSVHLYWNQQGSVQIKGTAFVGTHVLCEKYTCTLCWVHLYSMKGEYVLCGDYTCTLWWMYMQSVVVTHYYVRTTRVLYHKCTCTLWWAHIYYEMGAHVLCSVHVYSMWWVQVYLLLSSLRALASSCMHFLMSGRDALSDCDGWNNDNRDVQTERSNISYHVILTVRVRLHCTKANANLKTIFSLIFVAKAKATSLLPNGFIEN